MYENLQTALHSRGVSTKQYAKCLGVSERAAKRKLKGETDFTYGEFCKTCTMLSPEYNADYLFNNCGLFSKL